MENKQILYICLGIGVLIIILIIGFILYRKKEQFTDNYLTYVMTTSSQNQYEIQSVDGVLNPYTVIKSFPVQNNIPSALVTSDCFDNTVTFYQLNADSSISVYQNGSVVDDVTDLINNATVITGGKGVLPAPELSPGYISKCQYITTDTTGTLYVAGLMYTTSPSSTQPFIQQYTRTSGNSWAQGILYTYTPDTSDTGSPVLDNCNIQTVAVLNQPTVGPGSFIIYLYCDQPNNGACAWVAFTKNNTATLGYGFGYPTNATGTTCISITDSQYLYRCDNEGTLSAATTTNLIYTYSKLFKNFSVNFLGFDQLGYLLVSKSNSTETLYQAIDITTGTVIYSFTPSAKVLRVQVNMTKLESGQFTPDTSSDGAVCVDDNGNISLTAALPIGSIVMWHSISPPPTGWRICDGTNGTPKLDGLFPMGTTDPAGSDSDVTTTGGSDNVTISGENLPYHIHNFQVAESQNSYAGGVGNTPTFVSGGTPNTLPVTNPTDVGGLSYTPTPISILPPYYNICFIMKME